MSAANSTPSAAPTWLQTFGDLQLVRAVTSFIMWLFGVHFIHPDDTYPVVVRKSYLSCMPALFIFAGPPFYNIVCMYGAHCMRGDATSEEILALWLYNCSKLSWTVVSMCLGFYSRTTGKFEPLMFELFNWMSTVSNAIDSITVEFSPTISFVTTLMVVIVAGEMRYGGLAVFVNVVALVVYFANIVTDNKLMLPHFHGAKNNAFIPVWYELLLNCLMAFFAVFTACIVPGIAGAFISRESAKLRGAFDLSKRLARLTKSYNVDGMRAALQRYEMDPGCDQDFLMTQKAVLDNLERYRPYIPAYMIESTSSIDSEFPDGGLGSDGEGELMLHGDDEDFHDEGTIGIPGRVTKDQQMTGSRAGAHAGKWLQGIDTSVRSGLSGTEDNVSTSTTDLGSTVTGQASRSIRRSDAGKPKKLARLSLGATLASQPPLFSGAVSVMRLSFFAATQSFGLPSHAAGGVAGATREQTEAFKGRVRAMRSGTEALLLDCFRAAEATQGSVLSAVGDEITVAWNATKRTARPGVKACQFATLMRDAPRQTNRHIIHHHLGMSSADSARQSLITSSTSATAVPHAVTPVADDSNAATLLLAAHATTTRAHCYSGGDAKQRLLVVLELGLFHTRMMGLARLSRDLAFFAAARANDGTAPAAVPLQVVVDRATQEAAQFSHRFRPVGFLFDAPPAADTVAAAGRTANAHEGAGPSGLGPFIPLSTTTINHCEDQPFGTAAVPDAHALSLESFNADAASASAACAGDAFPPRSVPGTTTCESHARVPAPDRVAYELIGEQVKQNAGAFDEWMYEVAAVEPPAERAMVRCAPGQGEAVSHSQTTPAEAMTVAAAAVAGGADPAAALRQMQLACPTDNSAVGYLFFAAQIAQRVRSTG